jgi:magnesium transporter
MVKPIKKHSSKAGLPPGTLVHVGERKVQAIRITVIDYDEVNFQEKQIPAIEECFPFKATPTVTWINIDGLHQIELIEKIGKQFELHPLILEDILNTGQRPKFEDFDKYIFVVLKMLSYNDEKQMVQPEQVSFVLGTNYVISFQEAIGDRLERESETQKVAYAKWALIISCTLC